MTKLTYDQYFLGQLESKAARASCDRGRVACILTRYDREISTGYAGAPPGLPECDEVGHLMELRSLDGLGKRYAPGITVKAVGRPMTTHCIRTTHAEANAIANAARMGHATEGATAYVSMTPCRDCAKLLISAGIKRVVCAADYHAADLSKEWFELAGVELLIMGEQWN